MKESKSRSVATRSTPASSTMLEAFQKMDRLGVKLLLVLENNKYAGLVSSGDIQRAILKSISMDAPVRRCMRQNIRVATPVMSFEAIKSMMLEFRMEFCPVVDENSKLVDVYFWEDVFESSVPHPSRQFQLPVVIMAGGEGQRMRPLTNVLPKPLIPIKDKTMLEEIFDRFGRYGSTEFYVSVNYKADFIRYYVEQLKLEGLTISFLEENEPLGTAGSLSLLKGQIDRTFFVSNCDILIEEDYGVVLDYHEFHKNEITIVGAMKSYEIPYGTLEVGENGRLINLKEKPQSTALINSGMYILEPHLVDEIPNSTFYDITDLIQKLKKEGRSVGVYPVSDGSWKDVGNWTEFRQNAGL